MNQRLAILLASFVTFLTDGHAAPPVSTDDSLVVERFAAEPDVVTPVGIAVDPTGRVLVVESNTHFRPADYQGPTSDRIRTLEDRDGDGKAELVGTFFEGTTHTMGLGFHPDGSLLVATRREVFRLRDGDRDGKADGPPESLARLETDGDYPHNGLSGFAFDAGGLLYFGLGENLGAAYRLVGRDGKALAGGGEGGNVYRLRPDGSGLERVATGFWNPFHLAFDPFGRLFAVDNDPDSRPPCRLLRVVPGGDYGYRFRNGRKGLHPFTAWNGELPGTLPMSAGTGEAPSGILSYDSDQLVGLRGALLATSWGDHRIDAFRPAAPIEGDRVGLPKDRTAVVTGDEDFRPVGIAVGPDGSVFVSDWVDRSYNVHGKGRVWRIRAKTRPTRAVPADDAGALRHADRATREAAARRLAAADTGGARALLRAVAADAEPLAAATALDALLNAPTPDDSGTLRMALSHPSEGVRALAVRRVPADLINPAAVASDDVSPLVRAEALRRVGEKSGLPVLFRALADADPFTRQAARVGLRNTLPVRDLIPLAIHAPPPVRLGALLVLRDSDDPSALRAIEPALLGREPDLRFSALQWISEVRPDGFGPVVGRLLHGGHDLPPREFVALLATLDRLNGKERGPRDEMPGEAYVAQLVGDRGMMFGGPLLTRAVRVLRPDHPVLTDTRLRELLDDDQPGLQVEVLRTWRERPGGSPLDLLAKLAADPNTRLDVRLEAVVGLSAADLSDSARRGLLVQLASGSDLRLRREAIRSLRGAPLTLADSAHLERHAARGDEAAVELIDSLAGFDNTSPERPRTLAEWVARLEGPGDVGAGERLFFHPKGPGCYRCHQHDGRGGRSGPELTAVGRALTRERLVESILDPGKEVAPQFTTWTVALTNGRVVTGTRLGETLEGTEYGDANGKVVTVKPADVEETRPQRDSLMPAGLHRLMTGQEFRDLLAFMTESRGS